MEGLHYRTSLWAQKVTLCFCIVLFLIPEAKAGVSHAHSALTVSAPHLHYICPEGANVKLVCDQGGAPSNKNDILRKIWFFTQHSDHQCTNQHPRFLSPSQIYGNHSLPPGVHIGSAKQEFWVILQNLTHADQGRYCCMVVDIEREHKTKHSHRNHILLTITPGRKGSQECTVWDPTLSGGSVAVGLAIAACVLALLSLPLILVLVYKQRQNTHSRRRGQELVRMDSEAHGHENPVFLGESPQIKTGTVSQIMTRQSSETGRHLLSEPRTPFSPPAHGDVFFPTEDIILESSYIVQV